MFAVGVYSCPLYADFGVTLAAYALYSQHLIACVQLFFPQHASQAACKA